MNVSLGYYCSNFRRGQNSRENGKKLIFYVLLLPLATLLFAGLNAMAVGEYAGFSSSLHYVSSDAFGDISRMVEVDCNNDIDDDGDGLTDMEDIEDCA